MGKYKRRASIEERQRTVQSSFTNNKFTHNYTFMPSCDILNAAGLVRYMGVMHRVSCGKVGHKVKWDVMREDNFQVIYIFTSHHTTYYLTENLF